MTTYILHGGYLRSQNELNDSFYKRIAELVPTEGTILHVYFASRDQTEIDEKFNGIQNYLATYAKDKKLKHVRATREDFVGQVFGANVVILNGGSTNKLFEAFTAYPNLRELFEAKVVAGSSAGAYVLAAYNYDKSKRDMRTGFGFVPVRAICHYKSDNEKNTVGDEGIETMNQAHTELPLVVLKDCEWKEFTT